MVKINFFYKNAIIQIFIFIFDGFFIVLFKIINLETDKTNDMEKENYESPTLEVTHVETERTIAESGIVRVQLEDWDNTDNTYAPYDGDIWLNI